MNKTRQVQTVNSVTPVLPRITPTLGGSERPNPLPRHSGETQWQSF